MLKRRGQFILADIVSLDAFTVDTYIQAIELLRDPSHVRDHTVAQWLSMLEQRRLQQRAGLRMAGAADCPAERMATPPAPVAMIRTLMDGAPDEARAAPSRSKKIHSFTFRGAVLCGVRSG
ncbi:MAG: hypothetical protein R3A10_13880 [Caldilineaceae bacterium]